MYAHELLIIMQTLSYLIDKEQRSLISGRYVFNTSNKYLECLNFERNTLEEFIGYSKELEKLGIIKITSGFDVYRDIKCDTVLYSFKSSESVCFKKLYHIYPNLKLKKKTWKEVNKDLVEGLIAN